MQWFESLRGREIVLAGGTGGIGSAAVELLASEGARLVVSYRSNADRAARFRDVADVVQADLTCPDDRRNLLDLASELYGLVVFTGDPARVTEPSAIEGAMVRSHQVRRAGSHTDERTCVLSEGFPTSLPSRMPSRRGARAARS